MINTLPLSVPGHLNLTMLMMMTMLMMVGEQVEKLDGGQLNSVHYL